MNSFTRSKLSSDIYKNSGGDFVEFYHKVICKEFDLRNKTNISKLKNDLKQTSRAANTRESDPVFDTASKRCAYVFQNSPLISNVAAFHLLQMFRSKPHKINHLLNQGEVKVCCLGGGPGTDAVAICKTVTTMHRISEYYNRQHLKLQLTIIDNDENWKITAQNVMEELKQTPKFFSAKKINLSFQFLKADLTKTVTNDALVEISQADILTMFYFISSVQKKTTQSAKSKMIQRIFGNMKTGALLFFLDVPVSPYYNLMSVSASRCQNLIQLYGPHQHKLHLLPLDAVKKNLQLYSKNLDYTLCSCHCISTASAWCKESHLPTSMTSENEREKETKMQKTKSETSLGKKCGERNSKREKTDKQKSIPINTKLNAEEKQNAARPAISKSKTSSSKNAKKLKAYKCEIQKIRELFYNCKHTVSRLSKPRHVCIGLLIFRKCFCQPEFSQKIRSSKIQNQSSIFSACELEREPIFQEAFFLTKPKPERIFINDFSLQR